MRCPFCGHDDSQVKDSRPSEDNSAIRRRRHCPECGGRFTTFERVQLRELIVIKKNGRREAFDRDKLERSINHALRKRPVERERVDRTITGIVRRLESMGENEIPANVIGELVMQALASLDKVAYVRFASVYRNFRETRDFEMLIGELEGEEDARVDWSLSPRRRVAANASRGTDGPEHCHEHFDCRSPLPSRSRRMS